MRERWPIPPPSVRPPTPVVEMIPHGTASPCSCVARSTSPHVAPPCTRTVPAVRIDLDVAHRREVDHEPVVAHSEAARVVAAAANRDQRALPAPEVDRSGHVLSVRTAGDQARAAVDHAVVDLAGLVVAAVPGGDQLSPEIRRQSAARTLIESGGSLPSGPSFFEYERRRGRHSRLVDNRPGGSTFLDNVEIIRQFLVATTRKDVDGMVALVHDDLEFVPITAAVEGRTYAGHAGVRQFMEDLDLPTGSSSRHDPGGVARPR